MVNLLRALKLSMWFFCWEPRLNFLSGFSARSRLMARKFLKHWPHGYVGLSNGTLIVTAPVESALECCLGKLGSFGFGFKFGTTRYNTKRPKVQYPSVKGAIILVGNIPIT